MTIEKNIFTITQTTLECFVMEMENRYKTGKKFLRLFIYIFTLLIFIAFNFQDTMLINGWQRQYITCLPGNPPIEDMTFADSVTGYAVTRYMAPDSLAYIIKTSNAGNNWFIIRTDNQQYNGFSRVVFLNKDTGYVIGVHNIEKTTNGGQNWILLGYPTSAVPEDIFVLNTDTMWFCSSSAGSGGLWRSINGGLSWNLQWNTGGSGNSSKVYFYNGRIGFISTGLYQQNLFKTTNSGLNWTLIPNADEFTDMYFVDSLKGYKAYGNFKKTTDGGFNWVQQTLPNVMGATYTEKGISKFSVFNDTLYGVGGFAFFIGINRKSIVFKTTNGGNNWGYQIPDTNINTIYQYRLIKFLNSKTGWCYSFYLNQGGVHTTSGGDTTFYTGIYICQKHQASNYFLYQNYPNPFNSTTNIKVQMSKKGFVQIKIFDITGRLIKEFLKRNVNSGEHNFKFNFSYFTSGIYFYSLFVEGIRVDTKKFVLIK